MGKLRLWDTNVPIRYPPKETGSGSSSQSDGEREVTEESEVTEKREVTEVSSPKYLSKAVDISSLNLVRIY